MVQRCGSAILLCKRHAYLSNKGDLGFQFERLVTGGRMHDRDDGVVRDTPARHARVGLCTRDDWEATLKFGSARAARLARAFPSK